MICEQPIWPYTSNAEYIAIPDTSSSLYSPKISPSFLEPFPPLAKLDFLDTLIKPEVAEGESAISLKETEVLPVTRSIPAAGSHTSTTSLPMPSIFSTEAERVLGGEDDQTTIFPNYQPHLQPACLLYSYAQDTQTSGAYTQSSTIPYSQSGYWPSLTMMQESTLASSRPEQQASYPTSTVYPPYEPTISQAQSVLQIQTSSLAPISGSLFPDSRSSPTRSLSPNATDLNNYGTQDPDGSWCCAYPGCSSKARFGRGCDLRKHYKRHTKFLYCRYEGCPQATEGGFSSKKDCARHEAKHNPGIPCEWEGCGRLFSRVDNMKDHVRRIHRKAK
ncbi:MAG: hypothetical protein M1829_006128 [Trizodia sp. TS-e1964]|nr:MAG: hypothetical protein M1829_006128 [Trizodia sp. TS-e1964]